MLISRIQKDLFDFIEHDPEELNGLIQFWYMANSNALSAALTKEDGLKLIINVSSFNSFENLSKKLFLVADTLILRDLRKRTKEEMLFGPFPVFDNYKPMYLDDVLTELKLLKPSPLTIMDSVAGGFWLADEKKLNNGYTAHYQAGVSHCIPKEFIDWITTTGKEYLQEGSIVYAPFIPPIEHELEFLKNNISLPTYFNSFPCFHQNYEWLDETSLNGLFSLKFPFIENLDISTISKVKNDNYDEFSNFSSSILQSINKIKNLVGSVDFVKEVKYIQKNEIDDNLAKIEQKIKRISNMNSLRQLGIMTGLIGLNAAIFLGASTPTLASGLSANVIAMIMDAAARLKDNNDLKDNSSYLLWRLGLE